MKKSENALPSAARTLPESLRSPVVLSDPDGVDEAIASRVRRDWRAACAGLRSIVEFGALLIEVETWLKKRGGGSYNMHAGIGLKGWLAEHAPEVDYKTAMGYKYAASGLMALADKAKDRPLLVLMGEQPLSDAEEEAAREQVLSLVSSSSLRRLKAAAKADKSEVGPKKGGTSKGKQVVAESEREAEAAEDLAAAANDLGRFCSDKRKLRRAAAADLEAFETLRGRVADALSVMDLVLAEARQ